MAQSIEEADAQGWHKRFAMQCNNRAWELSTRLRTPAEDREMLDAAHASAWHWAQVGTELNRMRATMLLAEVHALLGIGPSAIALATEMRDYFQGRQSADWELALMHAIDAHAAHAAGQSAVHREAYRHAVAALAAIADEEDRAIVLKTFSCVPPP
jgi:hypothetical protein